MGLKEAIQNTWSSDYVQKNPNKAYKQSYADEYAKVGAFINGGAEPNWAGFSKLGKGLCEAEKERRAAEPSVPAPEPTWTSSIADGATIAPGTLWVVTVDPLPNSVEFWDGEQLMKTDATAPYSVELALAAGQHVLGACAVYGADRHCFDDRRTVTVKDSTAPPPPKGTPIDGWEDVPVQWAPDWKEPTSDGVTRGSGTIAKISTPHGPGFRFRVTDDSIVNWGTGQQAKALMTFFRPLPVREGMVETWRYKLMLPSQTLPNHNNDWGVALFEIGHTNASSGHHLSLYPDGRWRVVRQSGSGQVYEKTAGPQIQWGQWYDVFFQCKWSTGSGGWLKINLNGAPLVNFTGRTLYDDNNPYAQWGLYCPAQGTGANEAQYAAVTREVS